MTAADLDRTIDWAAVEGWNPGLDDAAAFRAAAPDGFLMGFLGDEPVAAISVVAYGAAFGFLGLYICRPEFRGQGHGWSIWQAGIARLGGRTIGLDGVVAQQANYAKSGFVLAHRNVRYAGPAIAADVTDPRVVTLGAEAPPEFVGSIASYDRNVFAAPRDAFIRRWVTPPQRRTAVAVEGGRILGYGTVRPCRQGHKIGPLFADTEAVAERLFVALTANIRGENVSLDVPEVNAAAVALARRHGLNPAFETARMYRGPAPSLALDRIFGITSFELG